MLIHYDSCQSQLGRIIDCFTPVLLVFREEVFGSHTPCSKTLSPLFKVHNALQKSCPSTLKRPLRATAAVMAYIICRVSWTPPTILKRGFMSDISGFYQTMAVKEEHFLPK